LSIHCISPGHLRHQAILTKEFEWAAFETQGFMRSLGVAEDHIVSEFSSEEFGVVEFIYSYGQ